MEGTSRCRARSVPLSLLFSGSARRWSRILGLAAMPNPPKGCCGCVGKLPLE